MATFPVLLNPTPVASPRPLNAAWTGALLGVVFVACTSTTWMGGHTSQAVLTAVWERLLGKWHFDSIGAANIVLRKVGHFLGHGLLSLVFCTAWLDSVRRQGTLRRMWWRPAAGMLAVLTTLFIASADELHQHFVPGRVGCVGDVLIDFAGALAANVLLLAVTTRTQRRPVQTFRRVDRLALAA